MVQGVVYVAYGEQARAEAAMAIASLRQHSVLPVAVISDKPIVGCQHIPLPDGGWKGRAAKVGVCDLSPFHDTLYLDADTRVHGDLSPVFAILEDGWDMALACSNSQGRELMWHVSPQERNITVTVHPEPLALQAGVMAFRQTEAVKALFSAWREEWARFGRMDQAALLRALQRVPARVWLWGRPWNAMPGQREVIEHLFGRAA